MLETQQIEADNEVQNENNHLTRLDKLFILN